MHRRSFAAGLMAVSILALSVFHAAGAAAGEVRVFAAASLKNALDGIAKDWKAETGNDVVLTYAASSALAKQVEAGAPADLFISADLKWMDYLAKADLIKKDSRENLLGNALVLVGPKDAAKTYEITKGFDLAGALSGGRLAVGAVESVPAGIYAKQSLISLGAWDAVKDKLAEAENVRAALLLVSRGEAPLGIVYMTDSKADAGVKVVGTFPENAHDPIIYPVAELKNAPALAAEFQKYLRSKKADASFTGQGFTVLSAK
ncbi:molybdate ABC transporter substrate-binding protein [Rhizobium sp. C1]|uniref:molybdate ABC transporter substrate-binding protein n=1 Tax=Rhizobium sp. C1 TaxID=1349799 RepID=UPI003FA73FBE